MSQSLFDLCAFPTVVPLSTGLDLDVDIHQDPHHSTIYKTTESFFSEIYTLAKSVDTDGDGDRDRKVVLKVVPFAAPNTYIGHLQPTPTESAHELFVTKLLCSWGSGSGFVRLRRAFVTNREGLGEWFVEEWKRYKKEKGSFRTNPATFSPSHPFLCMLLDHAGVNMTEFTFPSWPAVESAIVQVVGAVAMAEEEVEFEVRMGL
ncbi:hypothetical protein HDU93_004082 [Gonapodya sp. JEL0774]|nr:hypothetical protein HDU93_004082 [Gonapodya sp. JEL0774]